MPQIFPDFGQKEICEKVHHCVYFSGAMVETHHIERLKKRPIPKKMGEKLPFLAAATAPGEVEARKRVLQDLMLDIGENFL
ncbi:hypothetical protein EPA93_45560 [Ktedonosporobacter rubrisoli]|uniref:Uncharacterized protein n=1 Tax=Ktedonosporobacter rubrisoli TaxID=2509675 RepID=A0A4P6K3K8_KTERU|nr:hypothetical protein [Ktedonosporobacter rubrisoli]QBD82848.1 hypothetical protein EPA93_45560 [Ktedonosporobacter rubrisoli]